MKYIEVNENGLVAPRPIIDKAISIVSQMHNAVNGCNIDFLDTAIIIEHNKDTEDGYCIVCFNDFRNCDLVNYDELVFGEIRE